MGRSAIALCAMLALAACGDGGNTETGDGEASTPSIANDTASVMTDTAATSAATMSDENVAARLAATDSAEIMLGRLALEKAKNADVKAYAQMMVDHHTTMKNEGAAAAQSDGIVPVPAPDDQTPMEMQAAHDRLSALDADAFDRAYIDQMVADHQKAVSFVQANMGTVKGTALRAHMEKGLPMIQSHLDRAIELQSKVGATTSL